VSTTQRSTLKKLAILLNSPTTRLDVHRQVRQTFKGVKALCAATASEYLIRAGVLHGYRPWTSQLESSLKQKGWGSVPTPNLSPGRGLGPALSDSFPVLRLGDLCYSVYANRNGAPDHVFFFIRWLDRARLVAEVVDNYAPHPHPRNLGAPCWYAGRRLAYGRFSHAQRTP
jgi:hypothetical protein